MRHKKRFLIIFYLRLTYIVRCLFFYRPVFRKRFSFSRTVEIILLLLILLYFVYKYKNTYLVLFLFIFIIIFSLFNRQILLEENRVFTSRCIISHILYNIITTLQPATTIIILFTVL